MILAAAGATEPAAQAAATTAVPTWALVVAFIGILGSPIAAAVGVWGSARAQKRATAREDELLAIERERNEREKAEQLHRRWDSTRLEVYTRFASRLREAGTTLNDAVHSKRAKRTSMGPSSSCMRPITVSFSWRASKLESEGQPPWSPS